MVANNNFFCSLKASSMSFSRLKTFSLSPLLSLSNGLGREWGASSFDIL